MGEELALRGPSEPLVGLGEPVHVGGGVVLAHRELAAAPRHPLRERSVVEQAAERAATASRSIGTISASRSSAICSCTHGRSDSTHAVPQAIASNTERGAESELAIDTQTSAAA